MTLVCADCGLRVRLIDLICLSCRQVVPTWQHVTLVIIPGTLVALLFLLLFG
jgi:hypothetical protein